MRKHSEVCLPLFLFESAYVLKYFFISALENSCPNERDVFDIVSGFICLPERRKYSSRVNE